MSPLSPPRKRFTAEVRRDQQRKDDGTRPSAAPGEVLEALTALHQELAALRQEVRQSRSEQPEQTAAGCHAPHCITPDEQADIKREREEIAILKTEIRALAQSIQDTKREIAALRYRDSEQDRIVAATSELDTIVESTEEATHTILEQAEKIDGLMQTIKAQSGDANINHLAEDAADCVVAIFEACNFQDLTGQRVSKVVTTLQYVEDRVDRMIAIWGSDQIEELAAEPPQTAAQADDEAHLLNGPGDKASAISQADIDALFD
ncbi:protein phosphatase CheZ [Roseospirillum parvum]|uniref:Chemotaxis protein CheZ n=1 Tax=Roseospirillum parvum TaxID=83401 RepID=A0A1G7ZZ20_9PROT|nr:protein phosphatase CheZ [Roseospirillum parvum]SDH13450.1 chemotaxis protein CheZ [Roseospirillum parvum]